MWLTRSATWDIKLQTGAQTTLPLSLIPPLSIPTLSSYSPSSACGHRPLPYPFHSLLPPLRECILIHRRQCPSLTSPQRWSLSSSTHCRDCSLLHIASTPSPHRAQIASVSHMSSTTPPTPPSAQCRPPLVLRRFRSFSLDGCQLQQAQVLHQDG
ncbi:hypothetical protein B0H15DRAFT_484868 [Mycena belliarum]|uniref:Uncharacterized protein n=1 Tax=Mycena belliarum TaxID=1033014 RepID=A0AAD6XHZ2_9AGAR|nr:hypothetical protein B0H15DRAFT_484807 [Mycena belliae]KAJ7080357.1 hypothetical protein B0H15DRAFT_484868 [Mycena belliae]